MNKTEFHINICRPLVPVPGLTCAHGSAGCKASISPTNEYVNEVVSRSCNYMFIFKIKIK